MLSNIVAGVTKSIELNKNSQYVLLVSSDIPTLKNEMVDWLVKTAMKTKDDLYYGVCSREIMEKRFPNSKRTYTKLKDMEVCGADMNLIHVSMATEHLDTWEQLIGNRKNPFRQAAVIGLDTGFQFLTRQFTLQALTERASERIGIKGRAIIWPHAEPCMDVDKPRQLELLRADLARQQRRSAGPTKRSAPKKKSVKARPVKKAAAAKRKVKAKAKRR
jgi:hypothetical protein